MMEEIEYRRLISKLDTLIKYWCVKNKSNDKINTDPTEGNEDSAPSLAFLTYWTTELKRGCTSIYNGDHPSFQNEVTT